VVADLRELDRSALGWLGSEREYVAVIEEILRHPERSIRGCETAESATRRVVRAIEAILHEYPMESVAVFSHGILLTLFMSAVRGLGRPDIDLWRSLRFPDVAVIDSESWQVVEEFSVGRSESESANG
jgi:broad specificity phosphatase PhoE